MSNNKRNKPALEGKHHTTSLTCGIQDICSHGKCEENGSDRRMVKLVWKENGKGCVMGLKQQLMTCALSYKDNGFWCAVAQ